MQDVRAFKIRDVVRGTHLKGLALLSPFILVKQLIAVHIFSDLPVTNEVPSVPCKPYPADPKINPSRPLHIDLSLWL